MNEQVFAKSPFSVLLFRWMIAIVAMSSASLQAQTSDRRGPRIPNAIRRPPAWTANEMPFSVADYFRSLPPAENAASAYLDALFEFTDEVDWCFIEPDFTSRAAISRDRMRRFAKVYSAYAEDPQSIGKTEIAAALEEYRRGFVKLATAQQKPGCVFERDIGFGVFAGHATALRQMTRIFEMKVLTANDGGAIIKDIETLLRIAGDVRPRADRTAMVEAAASNRICCQKIVRSVLESPTADTAFCRSLAELLHKQEAAVAGSAVEVLRDDYLKIRRVLAELESNQFDARKLAGDLKLDGDRMTRGRLVCLLFCDFGAMPLNVRLLQKIMTDEAANDPKLDEALRRVRQDSKLEARMEKTWVGLWLDQAVGMMSAADFSLEVAALNEWYLQAEKRLADLPFRKNRTMTLPAWENTKILRFFSPPNVDSLWEIQAENLAWLRCATVAAECAANNRSEPKQMDDVAAIGRLTALLQRSLDPFDGKPLKIGRRDGRAVVYSVGPDGVDDQAARDWTGSGLDGKGDLVFPLPLANKR